MKKKFLAILATVILVLSCAFAFVACGDDADVNGTYYQYVNGDKMDGTNGNNLIVIEFKDGKFTETVDGMNGSGKITITGTYTVSGNTVTAKTGSGQEDKLTIVSDGILKDNRGAYYCKDGKTPPVDEEAE